MSFMRHPDPVTFIIPAVNTNAPKNSAFQPYNGPTLSFKLEKSCHIIATGHDDQETISKASVSLRGYIPRLDTDTKLQDISALLATATDHQKPLIAKWLIESKLASPHAALLHIRTEEGAKKLANDHHLTTQDEKNSVFKIALQKGNYAAVPALLSLTQLEPVLIKKTLDSIQKTDDKVMAIAVLNQAIKEKKYVLTNESAAAIQIASLAATNAQSNQPEAKGGDPLALIEAVEQGQTDMSLALMKHVNVNASTLSGHTALEYAVTHHRYGLVDPLIQRGANPNIKIGNQSLVHLNPNQTQDQIEGVRALLNQSIFARQAEVKQAVIMQNNNLRDPSSIICQYDVDEIVDMKPQPRTP